MLIETQGAVAAGFWLLDAVGLFCHWLPGTDAPQGNVVMPRGRRRRKFVKGTTETKKGEPLLGRRTS